MKRSSAQVGGAEVDESLARGGRVTRGLGADREDAEGAGAEAEGDNGLIYLQSGSNAYAPGR